MSFISIYNPKYRNNVEEQVKTSENYFSDNISEKTSEIVKDNITNKTIQSSDKHNIKGKVKVLDSSFSLKLRVISNKVSMFFMNAKGCIKKVPEKIYKLFNYIEMFFYKRSSSQINEDINNFKNEHFDKYLSKIYVKEEDKIKIKQAIKGKDLWNLGDKELSDALSKQDIENGLIKQIKKYKNDYANPSNFSSEDFGRLMRAQGIL